MQEPINLGFFDSPRGLGTRMKATGSWQRKKRDASRPPFGGIDSQDLSFEVLQKGQRLIRVAHEGGKGDARPSPYSPWWADADAFEAIIGFAVSAKLDPQTLFRQVQAVIPGFGPSNFIFRAVVDAPLGCFAGRSRPIYLYPNGTYSSLPPIKPESVQRAYDTQLPRVRQLYIPGLSAYDYPSKPGDEHLAFCKQAMTIHSQLTFKRYADECRRKLGRRA